MHSTIYTLFLQLYYKRCMHWHPLPIALQCISLGDIYFDVNGTGIYW